MKFLATLLLLLPLTAQAEGWCGDPHLGLVTVSRHLGPEKDYNEEHWGPYLRCNITGDWSYQLGGYRNSQRRHTAYGLVNYVPLQLEASRITLRIGGFAGFGTGYRKYKNGRPRGGLTPIVGGLVTIGISEVANIGVVFNHAVIATIVEVSF